MKIVYNDYEEHFYTGAELKELYPDEYLADGRHHGTIMGITVKQFLSLRKSIKDDKKYRVFLNDAFCKIMPENGDKQLAFFAHVPLEKIKLTHSLDDVDLHLTCPECGADMEYKEGRYGAFIGCTGYPECKHTEKILIIGKHI